MSEYKGTRSQDYQQAILVQDAVNLSGVVNSFSKVLSRIWFEAREQCEGTDWVNRHPISVLFSSKISSLTGSEHLSEFSKAFGICQEKAIRNAPELLHMVRASLKKHFQHHMPLNPEEMIRILECSVIANEEGDGRWPDRAEAIIIAENIPLPPPAEVEDINAWDAASGELEGYYIGHINNAVAAVYRR